MSDSHKATIFMAATLRLKRVTDDINHLHVEIGQIGRDLEATGKSLAAMRGTEVDRDSVRDAVERVWGLVDNYESLLAEQTIQQAALDRIS